MPTSAKLALAYFAGALTIAIATVAAGGHVSLIAFGSGALVILAAITAALSSVRRLRRLALILERTADVFDPRPVRTKPELVTREPREPKEAPLTEPDPESVEGLVYTWLHENNRIPKRQAIAYTREALRLKPDADPGELVALASDIARRAA